MINKAPKALSLQEQMLQDAMAAAAESGEKLKTTSSDLLKVGPNAKTSVASVYVYILVL
jgi:hypothetical protein